jgi:hypothetical protein
MSLSVVATPIDPHADLILSEEAKHTRQLLSRAGLDQRPLELLNECTVALSAENERLLTGTAAELKKLEWPKKPEFVEAES